MRASGFVPVAVLAIAASLAAAGADNVLTPEERRAGFRLLFDGKTMQGWQDPAKKNAPGDAWYVEDGCLKARPDARIKEDLLTQQSFEDFELTFDWFLSENANSGIKYRIQKVVFMDDTKLQTGPDGYMAKLQRALTMPCCDRSALPAQGTATEYPMGFEFQLLGQPPELTKVSKKPRITNGSLYAMAAPSAAPSRGPNQWNQGRLVVKGDHVEHWINGVQVVGASLSSSESQAGIREHWAAAPGYVELLLNAKRTGPFALQHHPGNDIRFRNLKIRRLAEQR